MSRTGAMVLGVVLFMVLPGTPAAGRPQSEPPAQPLATNAVKPEPFAFADFTWLTGNPRTTESPLDTKLFTAEARVDVNYTYPYTAWDASSTVDYMPSPFITFRGEFNHRAADVPYFAGTGGVTPPGGNSGAAGSFVAGWAPELRKVENRFTLALLVKF